MSKMFDVIVSKEPARGPNESQNYAKILNLSQILSQK